MTRVDRHTRGAILIFTLWVVALLSLLAYSLLLRARIGVRQAQWVRLEQEAGVLVDSLAQHALQRFQADQTESMDSYADPWMVAFSADSTAVLPGFAGAILTGEPFTLRINATDEFGKINVNEAPKETLVAVLRAAGVPEPDTLAAAIIDWRDPDHSGVAENDFYGALDPPYAAANGPLERIEELLFVRGIRGGNEHWFFGEDRNRNGVLDPNEDDGMESWPPDNGDGVLQPGLVDLLTVYGDGTVNANTAPEAVLRALLEPAGLEPGEVDRVVAAILDARRGPDGFDGLYQGSNDDRPFEDWDAIVAAVAGALGDEEGERARHIVSGMDVVSGAARFHVRARYPERGLELGGELLVSRADGEYQVEEWRDW